MKKIIYILLLVLTSGMALTSCTEDEVKPVSDLENGGGNGGHDPIK